MRGILLLILLMSGCAGNEYRFERSDDGQWAVLPLKLDGLYGARDGAIVKAEGYFLNGDDAVSMTINVFLRPPAEFQSGTYQAVIGGRMSSGVVECPSLAFQGGQTALPAVGGVFILKDNQGTPQYRVTIPATTLQSRRPR
jgi:hypothetical protein